MSERTATTVGNGFEPAKHLVNLNGRGEYLEVKWRLLWLRTEHPDATIDTELVRLEADQAVFRARVSIPGGGSATGWGSETAGDFRDFLEKAETKAIGRALAALGFGTQFCHDHEFELNDVPTVQSTPMRVVDSPVTLAANRGRRQAASASQDSSTQRATERQVKFILAIAREVGLDEQEVNDWSQELYSQPVGELNRRDASALIEALQRRRNEVA